MGGRNIMFAKNVVAQAQAWLGKKEGNGSHKEIIDIYNAHKPLARGYKVKYTDSWCATFVSAVAIKLGCTDIIPTECGCEKMINLFKAKGAWDENDARVPKAGDIIFYDWQDSGKGDNTAWTDHVGIVESCDGQTIVVIEGNLNNAVARREIAVNGKTIRGYGIPAYEEDKPVEVLKKPLKSIEEIAKAVINGEYGNGAARKAKLEAEGYNFSEVQAEVNRILSPKKKSLTEVAKEVINGDYGNGAERKNRIPAETGYTYAEVQKEVNRLLK
jgi:hypothetical protein